MSLQSPLRYPGGKSVLAGFLGNIIALNDLEDCAYYEPFAGGAGAALTLLAEGIVSELHLNDADVRIFAFWSAVLNNAERFAQKIVSVPLSVDEWRNQYHICANPNSYSQFDVAFAAFYMNRCNRSGVLTGAGPIGGYEQKGKWKLDVRFNRETLATRVLNLGKKRDRIHVSNLDAVDFLKSYLPSGLARRRVFVYLDPPYVIKGQRLYLNAYEARDHAKLARYMLAQKVLPWVMSYDDSDLVRELYAPCKQSLLPIRYTLQEKRTANELIIAPVELVLPSVCKLGRNECTLKAIA